MDTVPLHAMFKHICPIRGRHFTKSYICAKVDTDFGYGAAMVECIGFQDVKCYHYHKHPYQFRQDDFKC